MRPHALLAKVFALAVLCTVLSFPASAQDGAWQRDLASWRTQHVADLMKLDGWLSLAGIEWLQPGDNSFGVTSDNKIHVPAGNARHLGVLHLENGEITLLPPPGGFPQELLLDGTPAKSQTLRVVPDKDKLSQHLTIGTLNMYVIKREAGFALRIKDSNSPSLTGFHGMNWFEPNATYQVTA